jgi:uncharacterized protein YciI
MRILIFSLLVICACPVFSQDKNYSLVFLNKKTDAESLTKEQSDKIMEGHMANIGRLAKEGKLLAAGPFEGGGGIFVLNTTSTEEATNWLSTDPGIQAKRWNVEIFPFKSRLGGICPVSAPYDMVMYSFVRFDAVVSKYTASTFPQIIKKHDDYLTILARTGNVISEGIFGDYDGGILIMQGEVQREIFENDPGVQEGLIELSIKKLYIAKGSFCEK